MKIPCLINARTIRQRLMLLNSITVIFVLALIAMYTYQLISVENNLVAVEQVDDTFNSILGLRRYEKNIMLKLGNDNIAKAFQSIERVDGYLASLHSEIESEQNKQLFLNLEGDFLKYKTIFKQWCANDACITKDNNREESHLIRLQGQRLVQDATELAKFNRQIISERFKTILFWLTFLPAIIFSAGVIFFFSQIKSILKRLGSLKQATKSLAEGEFKPIPTLSSPDEISELILTFNQMGCALEEKQEQLIQSKKMASIGTFSSGIAHEINNPLNNISLSTDTLIEEFGTLEEEENREILDDIMVQTERASKIVKNLLDFSRAQSSEMQPLHIDFVLHKTINLIANELQIHKVFLTKNIEDSLPQINGDLHQLQQVFLNLIINAEQAIGDHGTIQIKVRATDDDYICTTIKDSGPGIAQENLEQIFDPFFTTKETGKGTGLGLSIVYGILKKHRGYIEVASTLDVGTTFSVYLPIYHKQKEQDVP